MTETKVIGGHKPVMNTANSNTAARMTCEESLQQWLRLGDGTLPGEFLRLQGLIPEELVALGLLRVGPGRWSDFYVAGPVLRHSSGFNQQTRVCA